jgi:hypothetical protein
MPNGTLAGPFNNGFVEIDHRSEVRMNSEKCKRGAR